MKSLKIAIHENLDPRKFSTIRYLRICVHGLSLKHYIVFDGRLLIYIFLAVPAPLILLTHNASDDLIIAGTPLTIRCVAIVNTSSVDTPISAMVSWLPSSVYEDDGIRVLPTTDVTSAIYQTGLVFDPILPVYSSNYSCLGSFWPNNTNTTPFVVGGDVSSRTIPISVDSK